MRPVELQFIERQGKNDSLGERLPQIHHPRPASIAGATNSSLDDETNGETNRLEGSTRII